MALLNGLVWGVIAGLCVWGLYHDSAQGMMLGGVMALAMLLNIVLGAAMGLAVPLVLKALNKDPAMGGSVLLTFMTDSGGFLIFLGLDSVFIQKLRCSGVSERQHFLQRTVSSCSGQIWAVATCRINAVQNDADAVKSQ